MVESTSKAFTSVSTTSRISRSSTAFLTAGSASSSLLAEASSFGKYVCKNRVNSPSELVTPMMPAPTSFWLSMGLQVSVRHKGHCVILYSPGWNAIGPSTKHFQQKRWLHDNSTMSDIVSRQIGHCCASSSGGDWSLWAVPPPSCNSEITSTCPSDSIVACNSAKSEPLKKLCRESHAARSVAVSSRPKCVCFRLFLSIFTTATAFQTAYFRSWSTSPRISTSRRKESGPCSLVATKGHVAADDDEASPDAEAAAGEQCDCPCCRSSDKRAAFARSSDWRFAKQAFTNSISDSSSFSKRELACKAWSSSYACNFSTTSLILFFKTL
mmetsp:Transcript_122986/g.244737  ORF Transcript_122986/g.244737 Transcript_122986/m.244737 type:complete len:326 (+) Transcript_122986:931-1908(+)